PRGSDDVSQPFVSEEVFQRDGIVQNTLRLCRQAAGTEFQGRRECRRQEGTHSCKCGCCCVLWPVRQTAWPALREAPCGRAQTASNDRFLFPAPDTFPSSCPGNAGRFRPMSPAFAG